MMIMTMMMMMMMMMMLMMLLLLLMMMMMMTMMTPRHTDLRRLHLPAGDLQVLPGCDRLMMAGAQCLLPDAE
jgi:hypothetical protein